LLFVLIGVIGIFMELNAEKIIKELERLNKTRSWLAEQMGVYPSWITYISKERPITQAERIGKVLGIEPRDLIK
jgi:plasmid maintenance system antidote protein VapI